MKRGLIGLVALALVVAAPVTADARRGKGHDAKNAARYCKELRGKLGVDLFRETYGESHAFGKCVSQRAHELRAARREARRACRAELGAAKLRHESEGKRRAFKRCVRAKLRAATAGDEDEVLGGAKECAAEREADPDAFDEKYGTDDGERNAFGKCVSSRPDDEGEDEKGPEDADDGNGEQEEPGDAPDLGEPEPSED